MSDSQKKVGNKGKKVNTKMDSEPIKVDLENDSSVNIEDDEGSEEVDDKINNGDEKPGAKRQRKERSMVWQYFTKLQKPVNGQVPCQCNKCKHVLIYISRQGTGNITRHIASCYGSTYKDVGQMILNSDMKLKSSTFNQNTFREMLVAAMVMHELPLSFVDYKGFKDLFKYLQPDVKANEFRYPVLARMARDFLTIPVSTVASESTFSASGRVLNEHRSSLSKDTVEALICTKDWLYGDCCSNQVNLEELTEDIMSLDITRESDASNSMNASKVTSPNASSSNAKV